MELEGALPKTTISPAFAKALLKFRAELKSVAKDAANPFFKSKYADLASIVEAAREPLSKAGLSYLQIVHESEAAKIETILVHESGETFSCGVISIVPTKRDAQGFGSAITYARRYSLQAALGIATEDDDGNEAARPTANGTAPKAAPKPQPAPKAEADDPADYCWYSFPKDLSKDQLEFLKRRKCEYDDSNGCWFCPEPLDKSKDGYRIENPYADPSEAAV